MKTALLTLLALCAFAANSLLCRRALGHDLIDAASFTTVRMLCGAFTLALVAWPRFRASGFRTVIDYRAAAMLFMYMACFSFAYRSLTAGTGALILFGAVQLTMFGVALRAGEPFSRISWLGLSIALGGLVYLVSPGLAAPSPLGAGLMAAAGVAWGLYSLCGRKAGDALRATAANFIVGVPAVMLLSLSFLGSFKVSPEGVLLAALSGAVASGLGYVAWYAALRGLRATRAATVQLSVPVIAAVGGVLLLAEPLSARLVLASVATLGGVALVLLQRGR